MEFSPTLWDAARYSRPFGRPSEMNGLARVEEKMLDLRLSNEELARQLLVSSPEGDETYDKGELRDLLYVPEIADRARYAAIFAIAVRESSSYERRASFTLEVINGLRRQQGLWDIKAVQGLLAAAEGMIFYTPNDILRQGSPRQMRLAELWNYHAGLVYREAGEYLKAAIALEASAGFARDPAKAAISRFCAAVEVCHHWLVMGDTGEVMARALAVLVERGRQLDEFRDNPDFSVQQWVLANAPTHRLYCHFLAPGLDVSAPTPPYFVRFYNDEAADLLQMANLSEPHRTTFVGWTAAVKALEAEANGDAEEAACRA